MHIPWCGLDKELLGRQTALVKRRDLIILGACWLCRTGTSLWAMVAEFG
jgi:hypothetical protein